MWVLEVWNVAVLGRVRFVKKKTVENVKSGTTYCVKVGSGHGFCVLSPADAILHHDRERHGLELFHEPVADLVLVLAPTTAPHAQEDERQDDDDDGRQ